MHKLLIYHFANPSFSAQLSTFSLRLCTFVCVWRKGENIYTCRGVQYNRHLNVDVRMRP